MGVDIVNNPERKALPATVFGMIGIACFIALFANVYKHGWHWPSVALGALLTGLMTSLAVPAEPRAGEHPENDLRPGGAGYQQHLWQATLGRDCHVFVNHPGGFFDGRSKMTLRLLLSFVSLILLLAGCQPME